MNGQAEQAITDSGLGINTKIVEVGPSGDLNGDEYVDVPLLVVQNTGGSGSFFYVAAALGTMNGFRGTNAVRIGDRIVPGAIEIRNQAAIVIFTDRYPWESFADVPSVTRSRSFIVENGRLREKPFAILTHAIARKLVITKWGDCSSQTCRHLAVNVLDGGGGDWYVEAT